MKTQIEKIDKHDMYVFDTSTENLYMPVQDPTN